MKSVEEQYSCDRMSNEEAKGYSVNVKIKSTSREHEIAKCDAFIGVALQASEDGKGSVNQIFIDGVIDVDRAVSLLETLDLAKEKLMNAVAQQTAENLFKGLGPSNSDRGQHGVFDNLFRELFRR